MRPEAPPFCIRARAARAEAPRTCKADTGADDLDKLLSSTVLEVCHNHFWKRYKLTYPPAIDSSDVLVSRLSGEFARRQLSLHDALKCGLWSIS